MVAATRSRKVKTDATHATGELVLADGEERGADDSQPSTSGRDVGDSPPALMDAFRQQQQLSRSIITLEKQVAEPLAFLRPTAELCSAARHTAQALYHYAVAQLTSGRVSSSGVPVSSTALSKDVVDLLPDLHVDNFDAEQIWCQLERHTEVALRRVRRLMHKSAGVADIVKPEFQAQLDLIAEGVPDDEDQGVSGEGESEDEGALLDGSDDDGDEGDEGGTEDLEEGQDDDDDDGAALRRRPAKKARGVLRPAEDAFMRFADMEKFLRDAERRKEGGDEEEEEDEEDEDEEGVDGGDEDEGLDGADDEERRMDALLRSAERGVGKKQAGQAAGRRRGQAKAVGDMMYSDFFGDDGDEEGEEEGEEGDDVHGDGRQGDDGDEEGPSGEAEEGEDADADDDDEAGGAAGPTGRRAGAAAVAARGKASGPSAAVDESLMSTHEKRMARLQERISGLEAEALGEKDWYLRGESDAARRPLNSALEVDMDFDTSARPPPQPTEEVAADLETLIKARIAEHRFDDVARRVAPPPERKTKVVELDDTKNQKGLGEVYAEKYVSAVMGGTTAADEKEEKVRQEARLLFQLLCTKLDALSHFHFTPKPVVADMTIRSEVAAVAMEEAGPTAASAANMQLPNEVFKPQAEGQPKAEEELDKDDRKRRRAQKKRAAKGRTAQQESERRSRAITVGGEAEVIGRKSDAAKQLAAQHKSGGAGGLKKGSLIVQASSAGGAAASAGGRSEFGKSRTVFAKLQEQQDMAKAGVKPVLAKDTAAGAAKSSVAFKL